MPSPWQEQLLRMTRTSAGALRRLAGSPRSQGVTGAQDAPLSLATSAPYEPVDEFPQGVASGLPTPTSIVLWTLARRPGPVRWELASDPSFTSRTLVATGEVEAVAGRARAVHVAVDKLRPASYYWYRFHSRGVTSPIGRTRTAPHPSILPPRLKFGFASCQMYSDGHFGSLRALAEDPDVDFVVHLGDYVYDCLSRTPPRPSRPDPIVQATTLADYRAKYALTHSDLNLQAMRAAHPLLAVWDDGEVGDPDEWGGAFPDPKRKAAGFRAWWEHMPTLPFEHEAHRVYRSLRWGRLAELFLLDERQYRHPRPPGGFSFAARAMHEPGLTLLGEQQRRWLLDGLAASDTTWRVLGNPLMMAPLRIPLDPGPRLRSIVAPFLDRVNLRHFAPVGAGFYLNTLQWDGYQDERRELLEFIESNSIRNVVALSGDIHAWFTAELSPDVDDRRRRPVLAEFTGSSVSTANWAEVTGLSTRPLFDVLRRLEPWLIYAESESHGHGLVEITPDDCRVTYVTAETLDTPWSAVRPLARFRVDSGSSKIHRERT